MPNEDEDLNPPVGSDDQAWRTLEALIGERIADGLAGGLSSKSVDEIVEEELS